ncbi:hypothetical protein AMS68_006182 [Peltaster fructicola]|uniref:J domain-containing protein n=1 Tax=Peltaster fructicola TaxID=286661 RepID=A0A6H0Y182_9PEZI|nr:hypothetical protein AMS68_006182 [Peltaster fructicola]
MLIRRHAFLTTTSTTWTALTANAIISPTSCHTITTYHQNSHQQRRRSYATRPTDDSKGKHDHHAWPETPKGYSCPTPYQILATTRTEAYSKTRFYNLVKLYHPDRGSLGTVGNTIPHHVRLERYRLIVAAHNILSDPGKRSAYDRLGMGWQGRPEFKTPTSSEAPGPFNHNWQGGADPIWANATWEDWERFHARRDAQRAGTPHEEQQPIFLSNTMFIGLVFVIVFCGSAMNYGRAQNNGQYFVEQRDIIHDRAAKELRRVRMEKQTMGNREDRVEWFIRQRDATLGVAGSDPEALRQELADRVLPNRDVCRSDEIVQRARNEEG